MMCFIHRAALRRWTRRSDSQRPAQVRVHRFRNRRFHGGVGCGFVSCHASSPMHLPDPKIEPTTVPAFASDNTHTLPAHLQSSFIQHPFVSSRVWNWSAMKAAVDAVAATSTVRYPLLVNNQVEDENEKSDDQMVLANMKEHAILGKGAFGQVYLVSEQQPDGTRRACAVKVQRKTELYAPCIVKELNLMKKLKHPFLINLEGSCEDQYYFYFKMPLLQGGSLSDRVLLHCTSNGTKKNQHGGLPEAHAKFYALCIADALSYMHSLNCMHRDLKPSNVMIDNEGYPVVVDLGLATIVPEGRVHQSECGTRFYMAPEVVHPKTYKGYGGSADHWSFGALVYKLVLGLSLYDGLRPGKHWKSRLRAICAGKIDFPKGVSDRCVDLVRKLLVKDPTRRLGSLEGGEQDILSHPWFEGLDIVSLRQRKFANVPWVPAIKDPLDTSNFPDCDDLDL